MRVWVTRTQPGAERTAARLRALGHEPAVAPVLEVRALPWSADMTGVGALAFTSANAVAAFARETSNRAQPVFAVGDATAAAALAVGFGKVRSAGGDVGALAELIAGEPPLSGVVLHVGGRPLAGDLARALMQRGVPARTATLYETVATNPVTPEAVAAVLVHSPEGGRQLARRPLPAALFACISEAAAAPLRAINVKRTLVASQPNEDALLACLSACNGGSDRS